MAWEKKNTCFATFVNLSFHFRVWLMMSMYIYIYVKNKMQNMNFQRSKLISEVSSAPAFSESFFSLKYYGGWCPMDTIL